MTPDEALQLENCTTTIAKIIKKNNGSLLVVGINPELGKLPNYLTKVIVQGEHQVLVTNLVEASKQSPPLKEVAMDAAYQLALLEEKGTTNAQDQNPKESIMVRLAQIRDMMPEHPEATRELRVLENHFKGLLNCKTRQSA